MNRILHRILSPAYMIKSDKILGEIPSGTEVYKTTWKTAYPAIVETVLIGMISLIDTIMVSSVGTHAIAAVGLTNQPKFIMLSVFFALNVGVTAITARRKGENDRVGANICLRLSLILSIVLGIIVSSLGFFFASPLISFAGAQSDTIIPATNYFKILMLGAPFTVTSLTINAAQRGAGNTRISMSTNLAANVVNLIFNYLLIGGKFGFPALGVEGAAIATGIGSIVGFVISLLSVFHKDRFLHLEIKKKILFDRRTFSSIYRIGSSAFVEQLCTRFGFFLYAKMVAELGTVAFSTHNICMSIITLSFTFGDGLGIAASSLVGQNLGRDRPDLSQVYGKAAQRIGMLISIGMFFFFIFGGKYLVMLFTSDQQIISTGALILILVAFSSPGQISQVILSGSLRGAGDSRFVAVISLISVTTIRPLLTYLFCYPLGFGVVGAWISLLLDQYTRLFFTLKRFSSGKWSRIRL